MKHNSFWIAVAAIIGLVFAVPFLAYGQEHQHKIPPFMLILTVHTPEGQPDKHRNMPATSLEECWESAKAFMEQTVPEGAIGISAGCGKSKGSESDT